LCHPLPNLQSTASTGFLLQKGIPKLCRRNRGNSKSTARNKSVYDLQIITKPGNFGVLDHVKRDKLRKDAVSSLYADEEKGAFRSWCTKAGVQRHVQTALLDCLALSYLDSKLEITLETTYSISRINSTHQHRLDATVIVNETCSITGVCEVKLPDFDMDLLYQIVDYMVDLRNSFNVRFVFGILTTYEKWRILWFEDTDVAATETSKAKFDELCQATSANEYSIGSGTTIVVYTSPVYDCTQVELLEVLASFLYKTSMTPIAFPRNFISSGKKYVCAEEDKFSYQSLPKLLNSFSYRMPDIRSKKFYILQYYHRGGDGRIALCCSNSGKLCVAKFLLDPDDEENKLQKEADLWNQLWNTKCRVATMNKRSALLMPFCFHIRKRFQTLKFCGFQDWNRAFQNSDPNLNDEEVSEFALLDQSDLSVYQQNPMLAAEVALRRMIDLNVKHDDLKWEHVALLPTFSNSSNSCKLVPILLDLTRVTKMAVTTHMLEEMKNQLIGHL
jgi:hypothetical protein